MGSIRPRTASQERHILRRFASHMGDKHASQVVEDDIRDWMTTMATFAPASKRAHFATVRRFYGWLLAGGEVTGTPFARLSPPKVPRSPHRNLNRAQAAVMLAHCSDARDRCIVELGLQLGLRRGEIAGLRLEDLDLVALTVRVEGKGGHRRVLPLTKSATQAVRDYLAVRQSTSGRLIVTGSRGRGVSPEWVGRRVSAIAYRARVKRKALDGVGTHSLRHTAATDTYLAHNDILAVKELLGHVSLATTEIYVEGLDIEGLRAVIDGRDYDAA